MVGGRKRSGAIQGKTGCVDGGLFGGQGVSSRHHEGKSERGSFARPNGLLREGSAGGRGSLGGKKGKTARMLVRERAGGGFLRRGEKRRFETALRLFWGGGGGGGGEPRKEPRDGAPDEGHHDLFWFSISSRKKTKSRFKPLKKKKRAYDEALSGREKGGLQRLGEPGKRKGDMERTALKKIPGGFSSPQKKVVTLCCGEKVRRGHVFFLPYGKLGALVLVVRERG